MYPQIDIPLLIELTYDILFKDGCYRFFILILLNKINIIINVVFFSMCFNAPFQNLFYDNNSV